MCSRDPSCGSISCSRYNRERFIVTAVSSNEKPILDFTNDQFSFCKRPSKELGLKSFRFNIRTFLDCSSSADLMLEGFQKKKFQLTRNVALKKPVASSSLYQYELFCLRIYFIYRAVIIHFLTYKRDYFSGVFMVIML